MSSARSWLVFGAAVLGHIVGVTQRTSFGVLGVDATDRFDIVAATLSSVAVVQIVVAVVAVVAIGIVGLLVARRRTRRELFEAEGIPIAPLWVALFRSRRASRGSAAGE